MKAKTFSLSHYIMFLIDKNYLYEVLESLKEVYGDGITQKELYPPEKILSYSSIVAEEYAGFFLRLSQAEKNKKIPEEEVHVMMNLIFKN